MDLPVFKYHPNPIETGAIESSDESCECCGMVRGFKAASTIYAVDEIETICPWCIADGSAASKFDGEFSDSYPLLQDGIKQDIVREVCERTPSFISWQQERWLSHCDDACEYLGDASKSDLLALSGEDLDDFLKNEYLDKDAWNGILKNYEKGGNPAIYKFRCRFCGKNQYYMDCT